MKSLILTALLSLIVLMPASAQNEHNTTYQVAYKVNYSLDSLNRDKQDTDELYLYTGSNFGVFTYYNVIEREKRIEKMKRKYGSNASVEYYTNANNPSFSKTFYKNLQSGEITTSSILGEKEYLYQEPETSFKWKIEDSTKSIKGYSAQKATTHFAGRDYVAWFTLEIPVQDGPYLFHGLPGLIVELYDLKKDYNFNLKSIDKLEQAKTWTLPTDAKSVTKSQFKENKEQFRKNALLSSDFSYMMSHTPGIEGSLSTDQNGKVINADLKKNGQSVSKEEMKRAYKENLKSQNNPIELD